jgi:hypothetical protein
MNLPNVYVPNRDGAKSFLKTIRYLLWMLFVNAILGVIVIVALRGGKWMIHEGRKEWREFMQELYNPPVEWPPPGVDPRDADGVYPD